MIYQFRANLYFATKAPAQGLYNHCEGVFHQTISVNPDSENAEFSIIELIENHHDESPTSPCLLEIMATTEPNL